MINKILCLLGFHKWENKNNITLRCTRCSKIDCIWVDGLKAFEQYSKTKKGVFKKIS